MFISEGNQWHWLYGAFLNCFISGFFFFGSVFVFFSVPTLENSGFQEC